MIFRRSFFLFFSLAIGAVLDLAPARALEVTGRVTDLEGAPLAGAQVLLSPQVGAYDTKLAELAGEPSPPAKGHRLARTRGDAEGMFAELWQLPAYRVVGRGEYLTCLATDGFFGFEWGARALIWRRGTCEGAIPLPPIPDPGGQGLQPRHHPVIHERMPPTKPMKQTAPFVDKEVIEL